MEVDGPSHETDAGRVQDIWRGRCLCGMGWCVVRVPSAMVVDGGDLVDGADPGGAGRGDTMTRAPGREFVKLARGTVILPNYGGSDRHA